MTERDALIALAYFGKIPSLKGQPIIKRVGSAAHFFNCSPEQLRALGISEKIASNLIEFLTTWNFKNEVAKLTAEKIEIITMADAAYPTSLAELPDAPYALFIKGTLQGLEKPSVAIVGTRRASFYAINATKHFSSGLTKAGATIISGLALGIDTAAHVACLESGGTTIAVLGGGIDEATLYPKNNLNLAREIIAKGGAIISEFPPGFAPTKYTFPLRNRIVVGLSRGVLVTEAPARSGALITAFLALEYNRDCFAIPADLFRANAEGSNALLSQGARIVLSPTDIAREYNLITEVAAAAPKLEGTEAHIFELIKQTARSIDELHEETGLDISAISSMLSVMELQGLVKNIGGGAFSI